MDKGNIIDHFKSGIKKPINTRIGVEHEKFLFYKKNNKRINYSTIKEIFKILYEFGWKPSYEGENEFEMTSTTLNAYFCDSLNSVLLVFLNFKYKLSLYSRINCSEKTSWRVSSK